ncbi:MAG: YqgE/AlgH family protein [Gammaproteobacteria bacterium]|nr:YqgE/AlgH family protein [Gammaproteobacteria bacterium]
MNLSNHFLIAMPSLADPNFQQTVTLICAHGDEGAMGIVVNRPLPLELSAVLEQMKLSSEDERVNAQQVYEGGPVRRDRGFVVHRPPLQWDSTILVSDEIAVSTSRDILEAISAGKGPESSLIALGYAGWEPGQLETEIAQNAWLSCPADASIIFSMPAEQRWRRAAEQLGIAIDTISRDIGHA